MSVPAEIKRVFAKFPVRHVMLQHEHITLQFGTPLHASTLHSILSDGSVYINHDRLLDMARWMLRLRTSSAVTA